ncbi:MAG: endonuclease III [Bacteroidales bacterium]|nr:endonuclease III [Bacteroidales bacterium]
MKKSERSALILEALSKVIELPKSELVFNSPFQLICAVLLSAQCTDKRVNMTTPALFERYPSARELAEADVEDVYGIISSISYPRAKARHLVEMAKMMVRDFGAEVPSEHSDLVKLPGVGDKTANVVESIAFGHPTIAVDTHVFRVSHRLGLSKGKTPKAVTEDLVKAIPPQLRGDAHHYLLLFGRYTCKAVNPLCENCPLTKYCVSKSRFKA